MYLCSRIFRIGLWKCLPLGRTPDGLTFIVLIFMYVIVEIQGQQFKAEKDRFLYVHYLGDEVKAGQTVEFDRVLLVDADGAVKVGAPTVEGAKVVCEVASHQVEGEETTLFKGDKVIVFKKKRRKGYRRKNGHRQYFSKVIIKDIVA